MDLSGDLLHGSNFRQLCPRCQSLNFLPHVQELHSQTTRLVVSMLLPIAIAERCPLCIIFRTFQDCEAEGSSEFGCAKSAKRKLHLLTRQPERQGWRTPHFEFMSTCSEDCRVHVVRFLPITSPQTHRVAHSSKPTRKLTSGSLDLTRVKNWIQECDTNHNIASSGCSSSLMQSRLSTTLRIIDCRTREVRLLRHHEP